MYRNILKVNKWEFFTLSNLQNKIIGKYTSDEVSRVTLDFITIEFLVVTLIFRRTSVSGLT